MFWWKLVLALAVGVASTVEGKAGDRAWSNDGQLPNKFHLEKQGSGDIVPDKVEVISSALRVLPRKEDSAKVKRSSSDDDLGLNTARKTERSLVGVNGSPFVVLHGRGAHRVRRVLRATTPNKRTKRSSEGVWRTPREHQFVTRERSNQESAASRSARLLEPESSASRYYPDERSYYQDGRRHEDYFRRRSGYQAPQKRIIYYATLPEIVRRPGEWTPPRQIGGGGYPHSTRDNEIMSRPDGYFGDTGTRVSSSIIGFSDKRETFKNPSYPEDLSSPTFTIIDAEPPYNYHHSGRPPLPPPDRYDNRYDQERYDYDRFDQRFNGYRNGYMDPYRQQFADRRPLPPRHPQISLPAQSITVVRKPLDVRPDSDSDYTTQGPPHTSSTTQSSSTSTTSGPPMSSYERTYKF